MFTWVLQFIFFSLKLLFKFLTNRNQLNKRSGKVCLPIMKKDLLKE